MKQWYCHIAGQQYGPISEEQLRSWAREGRLRPSDQVWCEGMSGWAPASTVEGTVFTVTPPPPPMVRPHRGGTVLALGILGLVCCGICGIIAWVMANNDLREMAAGRMDRSGEGSTRAGRVCGIISVALAVVGFLVPIIMAIASHGMSMQHHFYRFHP
jgi:hypothetical protein